MEPSVLRHALPTASVELCSQLSRLAELGAVGRMLGLPSLAALSAALVASQLSMGPLCHVTSSVVAHLAVQPVEDGTVRRRRDGRAQAAAAIALSALLTLPVALFYSLAPSGLSGSLRERERIGTYLHMLIWAVLPALLQAAAVGYLRAWQRLPTAALVILATAVAYVLALPAAVAADGLAGAAAAVAATHAVSLLLLVGFHHNAFHAREPPLAPPPAHSPPEQAGLATAAAERLRDLLSGFPFAALLATLRAGPAPMLVFFSLWLGCDAAAVAAISIVFALLQVCLAPWVALQLSVLTFAAKYLAQHRARAAYDLIWSSLLVIALLAAAGSTALWPLTAGDESSPLIAFFGGDARLYPALVQLLPLLPTLVFLKAATGLFGSYLAATGYSKEVGAAYCAVHWCASLPLAFHLGRLTIESGGANTTIRTIIRVHAAAWGATAAMFGVGYSCTVARAIPRPDIFAASGNPSADRALPHSAIPLGGSPQCVDNSRVESGSKSRAVSSSGSAKRPPSGAASGVSSSQWYAPRGGSDLWARRNSPDGKRAGRMTGMRMSPLRQPLLDAEA